MIWSNRPRRMRHVALARGCVEARYAKEGYQRQPNEHRERDLTLGLLRDASGNVTVQPQLQWCWSPRE